MVQYTREQARAEVLRLTEPKAASGVMNITMLLYIGPVIFFMAVIFFASSQNPITESDQMFYTASQWGMGLGATMFAVGGISMLVMFSSAKENGRRVNELCEQYGLDKDEILRSRRF
ncbi:hypothetical protein [Agrococcus jejuensis]|uniref:Uncharacterized protein n=1 Tax=Agrococcus jejuensis TaxID=399736 RepID=A0A1G8A4P3_9MICO|nr:hypothetical protein [Agrococcus jejuensis]SDH15914.1 hypothetical protein SAMN04489720_0247 [Agrococcus jejuensis]